MEKSMGEPKDRGMAGRLAVISVEAGQSARVVKAVISETPRDVWVNTKWWARRLDGYGVCECCGEPTSAYVYLEEDMEILHVVEVSGVQKELRGSMVTPPEEGEVLDLGEEDLAAVRRVTYLALHECYRSPYGESCETPGCEGNVGEGMTDYPLGGGK